MSGGSQLIPDKKRLRWILIVFFLALAIPTAILVYKSLDQLKWEAVHQYRGLARELSERIDADLARRAARESSRGLNDYQFFSGAEPGRNVVQRSSLSVFPTIAEIPGTIGYFQVDANGRFSSPLLPTARPDNAGLSRDALTERRALSQRILQILSDNELIAPPRPGELRERSQKQDKRARLNAPKRVTRAQSGARSTNSASDTSKTAGAASELQPAQVEAPTSIPQSASAPAPAPTAATAGQDSRRRPAPAKEKIRDAGTESDSSRQDSLFNFDQLSRVSPSQKLGAASNNRTLKKLDEYKLDLSLQKRAANQERAATTETAELKAEATATAEKPASARKEESVADRADTKITTFEKDVDPFALSRLNSGHFVLYRKAWSQGQRLVQGLLIDSDAFTRELIQTGFLNSGMAATTDLTVAFGDSVLKTISGPSRRDYLASESVSSTSAARTLSGSVLNETALSEPFNNLRLIYSVNQLPSNVGSSLVTWLGLLMLSVLGAGLYALYRLGLRRLELASQQQDFVAAVSHEFKTPLTSIRMYSEMLREGWTSEEKKTTYYDFIHDESERLSRLIDNVLQLARVNRNDIPVNLRSVTLSEVVDMIRSKTSGQIERAGFTLSLSNDRSSDDRILVDSDLLQQVMINLIDNALKFSAKADKRQIDIDVGDSANGITLSVRDYGPGIADDQIRKIFQLFYRAETELTRETVGTGIGLALVNQLVKAMNGKVDVLNKNPGAEFRIELPRA